VNQNAEKMAKTSRNSRIWQIERASTTCMQEIAQIPGQSVFFLNAEDGWAGGIGAV